MNKYSKSICRHFTMIFVPMIIIIIAILLCIINSTRCYTNSIKYYTNRYYTVSCFSEALGRMNVEFQKYNVVDSEFNYNNLAERYEELSDAFDEVYSIRFDFKGSEIKEIENTYSVIVKDIPASLKAIYEAEDENREQAVSELSAELTDINSAINKFMARIISTGNSRYYTNKITIYISIAVMMVTLAAFTGLSFYIVSYAKRRIAQPIRDISEWAKQFEDGYTGMKDLDCGSDDEIAAIAGSFNIVKNNLAEAKQLKIDNEKATRRLREEEANKMKFVKQLYNEKREKEHISSEAKRDGLTGLYNRRSFDALIEEFISGRSSGVEGALFLIDMDYFKNVNDTLGHLAGDEALKTLAGTMRLVFPAAYLGRYGGDEFIAFVTGQTSDEDLNRFGKDLCNKMDMEFEADGKKAKISVSVGIASTRDVENYSELYMRADKALYFSKENGRNQYTLASRLPK